VQPPLQARIAVLRPQLERLRADVLCLQEINAQAIAKRHRGLVALDKLLAGTNYEAFRRAATVGEDGGPLDVHNLVILSRFPILEQRQYRHDIMPPPFYRPVTAAPPIAKVQPVEWERPGLYARLDLGADRPLHVFNLHLRAPRAVPIQGQKLGSSQWRSIAGWAEGFFLATIKRVGQAVETRLLVDRLFDADAQALVMVAGDLNADLKEMPLRVIVGDLDDLGNPALADRQLIPVELALPAAARFSVRHKGEPQMFDHLLASPMLHRDLVKVEAHNAELPDEVTGANLAHGPAGSFHAPLVAEFVAPCARATGVDAGDAGLERG
jgi:endonuclease/exonuclease/phosphatase family metal-dependent hydrolase